MDMVEDYLNDNKKEAIRKIQLLKKEQSELAIKLKENTQFIKLLEIDTDDSLQAFSPREVNAKNGKKIKELKDNQQELEEQLKQVNCFLEEEQVTLNRVEHVLESYLGEKNNRMEQNCNSESKMKVKMLEVQENERKRIARELHDDSVQQLASVVHKIELCSKLLDMDTIRCKLELLTMSNTVRGIIEGMRQMIFDLRPMSFDDIGVDVAIERSLDKLQRNADLKINFKCDGEVKSVNKIVSITLLRIITEACNNAIKYSNAEHIDVEMHCYKNNTEVIICDDGDGFEMELLDKKTRESNSGFGIPIMKERAYLLSGEIKIESKIGSGTKICVNVPTCKEEERQWQ